MKAKVKRIFPQYDDQAKAWVWMREYVIRAKDGSVIRRETRKSPCQCNPTLMGR